MPALGAPRILAFRSFGFSGISGCSIYNISCSAFYENKKKLYFVLVGRLDLVSLLPTVRPINGLWQLSFDATTSVE